MLKVLLSSLPALALTLSVAAETDDSRVEQLERTLQERDMVIGELLDRVEALERRIGVERVPTEPARTKQRLAATAPTPVDDLGPVPAETPGRVVVDEAAAERALERSLTLQGALLLPSGVFEFEPGFSYVRREDRFPALVPVDGELTVGEMQRNVDDLTLGMVSRLGLPWDFQLEVGVPYQWRKVESVTQLGFTPSESSSQSESGWGDVRVGLAKTLLREGHWRPDLIGRLTWDTDTGDTKNDTFFGDGFEQLQGSLTAIKREDPIAFVAGVSYEHPFEKDDLRPGSTIAATLGGFIALSPETSLQISIAGAYQGDLEVSGDKVEGTDRTFASLILGGSTLVAPTTLVNVSAVIGLTDDADDVRLTFAIPVRSRGRLF